MSTPVSAPIEDQSTRQASWLTAADFTLLVGVNLIWGLNLVAAKLGITEFPPIFFAALRFAVLGIVLIPKLRIFPGQMRTLLLAAIYSGAVGFALMYAGFALAGDVSSIAIATQLGVPISTLLSIWMLGEHIRWRRKLGIILAFAGTAVISFDPRALDHLFGLLLVIASQLATSMGFIYIKRLRGINAFQLQAWLGVVSAPALLVISFVFESNQINATMHASWVAWVSLLFTATISSLVAHTAMYHLIGKYPVTSVAPVNVLSALFSIVCGVLWFGDRLGARTLLGGGIALLGVIIVAMREKRMVDVGT